MVVSNWLWGNPGNFVGAACGCVVEFLYMQIKHWLLLLDSRLPAVILHLVCNNKRNPALCYMRSFSCEGDNPLVGIKKAKMSSAESLRKVWITFRHLSTVLLCRGFNTHYRGTWLVHILIFPCERSQNYTPSMRSTNIGACCVDGTKKISWSSPPLPYFSRTGST